jgi:hypothetical protein
VPLPVTAGMADGQVLQMTVTPFTQGLDMFKRRILGLDVLRAHPAGHYTMQLAGHSFIYFVAGVSKSAHRKQQIFQLFGAKFKNFMTPCAARTPLAMDACSK